MQKIIDFNECETTLRFYGGAAGSKLGILYQGEPWFLKFPKSTKGMRRIDTSYTTAPLSEYCGSHVYEILGYDVHQTLLGIKDSKIVVACKDFTDKNHRLQEYRELKNAYNKDLEEQLDRSITESDSGMHGTNLQAVMIHLDYNPVLIQLPEIKKRFWDCVVIDGFINNNDRNSGNWGILIDTSENLQLAPIYDNGAAFSNKLSDQQIQRILSDPIRLKQSTTMNISSGYLLNGKLMHYEDLINQDIPDLKKALQRVIPNLREKIEEICNFIQDIPLEYQGLSVISSARKEFYVKGLKYRFNEVLIPAYEKCR